MPPKNKITKTDIINTAMDIVRNCGAAAINARNIAGALGCSTQPVFSNFATMDDLRAAVKAASDELYRSYLAADMSSGRFPPYKASGMAYIRFAREESELFKLLFMCDRSTEVIAEDRSSIRPLLEIIQKSMGIDEDRAYLFHLEMWIYVHGIATMIATCYLNWDEDMVSKMLTDAYIGMKHRYTEGKADVGN